MKESKIIWFNNCSSSVINKELEELEKDGWEVAQHQLAMAFDSSGKLNKCVSALLKREKN